MIAIDQEEFSLQFLTMIDRVNTSWQSITVEILSHSRSFNELVKCSEKYNGVKDPLEIWLDDIEVQIKDMEPIAIDIDVINLQFKQQKVIS